MNPVVPATDENIERAAALLRAGELVSFPTETVYGLGGDASNPGAVRKIFAAKGRPADHPLIVHLAGAHDLGNWAGAVPEEAIVLAREFWPGPLTLVLKRAERVPLEVTGGQETVAVRVPRHPVARQLLDLFDGGIAAPSANPFGRISPTSAQHVARQLGERVSLILDGGPSQVGLESTIVDLTAGAPRILRPGGIGRDEISKVLGQDLARGAKQGSPRVPGALDSHYSPGSPLELTSAMRIESMILEMNVSVLSTRPVPAGFEGRWLQLPENARGYARELYAALHELDLLGLPIVVEEPPADDAWEAVRDRLRRASAGRRVAAGEGAK